MAFSQGKYTKVRLGISFFVLTAILTAVFFFLFSENYRAYSSKVTIMFIPKSESAAFQSSAIIENLVRFPRLLSFYERMLTDNSSLTDQFSRLSKDSRKKMWNKSLFIKKDDGSTMINIEVTLRNRAQSALFARQTARTLFDTASFYYNIKTDADFRIIDGPTTKASIKSWYWLLILSLILGLISTYILSFILSNFSHFFSRVNIPFKFQKQEAEAVAARQEKESFMARHPLEHVEHVSEKRFQAPANLPVAEEYQFSAPDLENIPPAMETQPEKIVTSQEMREPTEEELKRRLNQLLRGEL